MKRKELAWISEFYKTLKPHLFLRDEDNVLILPPNMVYKVNRTGYKLLKFLAQGGRIEDIEELDDEEKAGEVQAFFTDLKDIFSGELKSVEGRAAIERTAYGFDFTRLPVLGEIAVTYRCNNSCLFCYAACGSGKSVERELELGDIKKIIDIFKNEAKIPFFSFTGGEPLLRDDLESMIRYACSLGLSVNLITNGTLATEKRAKLLFKSGLRTAQVSVEAPLAELHDALTGTPGSFVRCMEGMRNLIKAGISVQTNTTINKKNASAVADIPELLRDLGVKRFSMNLFIPTADVQQNRELFLPYSETGPIVDLVRKKAFQAGLTFYWYSPMPHCIYNPLAKGMGNKSCAAMDGLLSVSSRGKVLPCSSYDEPLGNLLETPFHDIWFSERARHFKTKQYAPAECAGCDKFIACQAACPLYWNYAGTDEIRNPRELIAL